MKPVVFRNKLFVQKYIKDTAMFTKMISPIHAFTNPLTSGKILLGLAVTAFLLFAFDHRLKTRKYCLDYNKGIAPLRIAHLSDLHNCRYGKDQERLIQQIDSQSPDLIMFSGDMFSNTDSHSNTEKLFAALSAKYPCFYATGNHEYWYGEEQWQHKKAILDKYGISLLSDACKTVNINGNNINICGLDDPTAPVPADAQVEQSFDDRLSSVNQSVNNGYYSILLSHRPEYFKTYTQYDFDLVLCGHAHGGQWRIPFLLNGLYAPHQGMIPKYAGGLYEDNKTTMIVSRGLSRWNIIIPRIFNRPELVIIDIR